MTAVRTSAWRIRIERTADALVPASLIRYREPLQYLGVGAWNTLFGYATWAFLQSVLHDHLNYLAIVVLSYPIAIANAYVWYRYVVFRSRGRILREVPRFSIVYMLTMVVNLAALPLLLDVLPFNIYVTQALFTMVVVVASYFAHRLISFRSAGGSARRRATSSDVVEMAGE